MSFIRKVTSLRLIVLLVWGIFALVLTTQSDHLSVVHLMTSTIGATDAGDAIGHGGLFGMFALLLYLTLSKGLSPFYALMVAMGAALLLGAGTEWLQTLVSDRDASLVDLLADWLGVFIVGFALLSLAFRKIERATSSPDVAHP